MSTYTNIYAGYDDEEKDDFDRNSDDGYDADDVDPDFDSLLDD